MAKNSQLLINIGKNFSIAAGLPRVASWNSAGRPKKPKKGTFGFNTQTKRLEYWDGTNWLAATMSEN